MRRLARAAALTLALPVVARADDPFADRRQVFRGPVTISRFYGCAVDPYCMRAVVEQGISRETGVLAYRGYFVDLSADRPQGSDLQGVLYGLAGNLTLYAFEDTPAAFPAGGRAPFPLVGSRQPLFFGGTFLDAAPVGPRGRVPIDRIETDVSGHTHARDYDVDTEALIILGATVTTVTPEPATWALLGTGLVAVGAMARRRGASVGAP